MTSKTAKAENWAKALPKRLAEMRKTAERRVQKGWEDAIGLLPPVARKTIRRVTVEADRVRHDWSKRSDRMVATVRKRVEDVTEDMQKRLDKSMAPLQKRFEKSIQPLMGRLDVASKTDIDRLQRRVHALEKRMHVRGSASPSA